MVFKNALMVVVWCYKECKLKTDPWVKVVNENFRVEVDHYRVKTEREMNDMANELNDLFKDHSDWKDFSAQVNYDEVERCIFCGEIYVGMYLNDDVIPVCSNCGKGKLEYSIKILAESEEKSKGENILS